jgi:hypothetical protein
MDSTRKNKMIVVRLVVSSALKLATHGCHSTQRRWGWVIARQRVDH